MGDKLCSQSRSVPSCLHTQEKKPLDYFIQLLRTNRLRVFLKTISSHQFLKTLTQLVVVFRVFRFSAGPFNAVTSSTRNIFKPGSHLGTEI